MTFQLYSKILREEVKRLFLDLKTGQRQEKLKKNKLNSLRDIFYKDRPNPSKLIQSCSITFGKALENAGNNYVKQLGKKTFNGNFLGSDNDGIILIKNIIYNIESKGNGELDNEKSEAVRKRLIEKEKKVKAAKNANLRYKNENIQVISKLIIWTKPTSKEAKKITKSFLFKEENLWGFKDFFKMVNEDVTEKEYYDLLQNIWKEEIEIYFTKNE